MKRNISREVHNKGKKVAHKTTAATTTTKHKQKALYNKTRGKFMGNISFIKLLKIEIQYFLIQSSTVAVDFVPL